MRWSDEVVAADREWVPVIEWPAAQPVVAAVGALAAALTLPGRLRLTHLASFSDSG